MDASLSTIKQPQPSVSNSSEAPSSAAESNIQQTTEKRKYNRPNVGVVQPAPLSRTPMADTVELKRKENPFTKYKLSQRKTTKPNFQSFASFSALVLGLGTLVCGIVKRKLK